jgi:hypothetical protein
MRVLRTIDSPVVTADNLLTSLPRVTLRRTKRFRIMRIRGIHLLIAPAIQTVDIINHDTPFTTLDDFSGRWRPGASLTPVRRRHNDTGLAKSVNQAYAVVITPIAQEVT